MFISFFCIATEPLKNKYPILESIKSILPLADEIVVILGRDEEESARRIRDLDKKVKIYKTDLWPIDWSYDVMTYHFDYGLKKCQGDFCVKFDIDYIFKYEDGFKLDKVLKEDYHKIYLPKYNYLDRNHWMIFKKGIYCINKKLILKEHNGDMDSFFVGNRNYVNELIIQGEMREHIYGGNDIKVFNYDCSFMDKNLFYEKQYRWYNAYYKKWGNLNHFGLTLEILNDEDKLIKFVIDRTRDRIFHAIKNGTIYFDTFKYNPALIRGKLRGIKRDEYGYNYFGIINLREILYEKIDEKKLKENMERIKRFYGKMEEKYDFMGKKEIDMDKLKKMKEISISKFS